MHNQIKKYYDIISSNTDKYPETKSGSQHFFAKFPNFASRFGGGLGRRNDLVTENETFLLRRRHRRLFRYFDCFGKFGFPPFPSDPGAKFGIFANKC